MMNSAYTIKSSLRAASAMLQCSDSPQLDAELLLAAVLNKPREFLYTWPEYELKIAQFSVFQRQCLKRQKGHPIAYLIEKRSFWDFDLYVNAQVLIPRPETELLVELALQKFGSQVKLIVDLGTGSGAIALALASERKECQVLACDISNEALQVAKFNAKELGLNNISFRQGSWCQAISGDITNNGVDGIIANPPYIDKSDEHLQQGDVRFEPELALVSEDDGLADIKLIAEQSKTKLKSEGWLMLEHGYQQAQQVRDILINLGYSNINTYQDLAGNDRVTIAQN